MQGAFYRFIKRSGLHAGRIFFHGIARMSLFRDGFLRRVSLYRYLRSFGIDVLPGCHSSGMGKMVDMGVCMDDGFDNPFSRFPVVKVKTFGHDFFRDERGNDHDAFLSLHNSYVRKTVPVNLVNSFRDFKQRSFGIGTGNAPRIRFVFGALFRILHAVKVILVCSVHSASPYGHCQKRGGQTVYFYDHIGALLMECAKNKREACFPEFTM